MTRVATIPLQTSMASAITRVQIELAETQQRISTGKKALDYADLGSAAPRVLSARSALSRVGAYAAAGTQVSTTLSIYDVSMGTIDTAVSDLRKTILETVGTGQSSGLQAAVDSAFHAFQTSLNATERGVALFSGGQTNDAAFGVTQLANLVGTTPATVFGNDQLRASAELADGQVVQYGVLASDAGNDLYLAFRTLAEAGTFGATPTAAQQVKINEAMGYIDSGLSQLRTVNADNGRRLAQVDTLSKRAEERSQVWQDIVSSNEDADLAQVAIDLNRQQMVLEASYSVFARLAKLSLNDYL